MDGAFLHDTEGKSRLIQVRIEDCEIPRLLKTQVHINLVGLTAQDARIRLLSSLQKGRQRPASQPPFPNAGPIPAQGQREPRFPALGPSIINLPPRNPVFTGRRSDLRDLHRALTAASTAAVVQQATVHGLGGIGKTQLALEYAHRRDVDYDIIWWISAERPIAIPGQLLVLAHKLGIPDFTDQSQILASLWDELRQRDRWLLIYDNSESLQELLPHLPPRGAGKVIITSRASGWGSFRKVRLDVLRREEGVTFLKLRTGSMQRKNLDRLAAALGDLPLALEQAAAYLDETQTTPADYICLLRENESELLGLGTPSNTQQTIATVWQVSLGRLLEEEPNAQHFLSLCAFLAPDAIPRRLLSAHATDISSPLGNVLQDQLSYNRILSAVGRYSLMTITPDTLTVHRLVQTVARSNLSPHDKRYWASTALSVIDHAFPRGSSNPANWGICSPLVPHALVVADHAEELGVDLDSAAGLLNDLGVYLWARSELEEAKELHTRALSLEEVKFGTSHLLVANSLNNLGLVLWDLIDLPGTKSAHQRALRIRESHLGAEHPAVAASLNNLGVALWDLAEFTEARNAHQRALRIFEGRFGSHHSAVAASLTNLASVLGDLGELKVAYQMYLRALGILFGGVEQDHFPERTFIASATNDDPGELAVARAVLDPALSELTPIAASSDASRSVGSATLRSPERIIDDAQALQRILANAAGSTHPAAIKALDNLGVLLARADHLQDALTVCKKALSMREESMGRDHPDLGWSLTNLGIILARLGDPQAGISRLEAGLDIRAARLGYDHPDVATNLSSLGTVLTKVGRFTDARIALERALSIRLSRFGPDHPATRVTSNNLDALLHELGGS